MSAVLEKSRPGKLRARSKLIGKHLDEALSLARGHEILVVYGSWGLPHKRQRGILVMAVNERNQVTKVW